MILLYSNLTYSYLASRYALQITKLVLIHILMSFDIVESKKSVFPIELSKDCLDLSSKNGFWFGLKKRSHEELL